MDIQEKLSELHLTLPDCPKPIASYIPASRSGNLIFVSGQLPQVNGDFSSFLGKVPSEASLETAQQASRICMLNNIAAALTLLDSSETLMLVQMQGFVQSDNNFFEQPSVLNGASELAVQIFGENGKHARVAIGVSNLPKNACVEISCTFEAIPKEVNYNGRYHWFDKDHQINSSGGK